MENSRCPFCGKEMVLGYIYAPEGHGTYWLPAHRNFEGYIVSERNVKKSGGFVLGSVTKIGFWAKEIPPSYYCQTCKRLITELE